MNDYKLVLAVGSKERREYLCEHYRGIEEECSQGLKSWRNRKSIVKPDQFQWMLLSNEITLEEFSVGVKKLNSKDIQLLYHFLQTESWYNLHREILKDAKDVWKYADEDGFRFFARPYLNWLQKNLDLMLRDISIKITEGAKEAFTEAAFNEILEIIKKTLVYDHAEEYKPDQEFENRFLSYTCERFADESTYNEFFNDYPVLARLLAARVHYTMVNLQEFITALEDSREKLKVIFNLEGDFILQDIRFNKSDSHNKGKTVILFTLNGARLVFKYKNLVIGDKLNDFFSVIEKLNPSVSFYKVKRITTSDYTFEEYIEHEPCLSIEEVSQFYRHFGELVCISYVLCGNDLHLENVISKRNYPVLIDVETFIQNQIAMGNEIDAKRQYLLNVNNSILGSHLLPSVFEVRDGEKSLEISALSGDEQIAPYKVLQLVNDEKGRMRMEYQQYVMEGAENIPVFRNKKIYFEDYFDEIWQGFSATYKVICSNKEYIQTNIEKLFSKLLVRNVLKGTQKYADILNFAYHPSYMTNYINRDKLFENIWAHPHNNPTIIKFEVEDLLVNDIPVFYNQTSEKSLITSEGKVLPSYYSISALENVQRRLAKLSERDLLVQKNHLCIALGKFRGEVNPVYISYDEENISPLERAKQITDYICEQIVFGSGKKDITLPAYFVNAEKRWKRDVMSYGFYDGLSGIYILLKQLTKFYPEEKYFDLMFIMDRMFFETIDDIKSAGQYVDYMSLLYVVSCKLEFVYNIKDAAIGQKLLNEIKKFYQTNEFTDEWLFGRASLIKVCLKFYQCSGLKEGLEFAKILAEDIKVHEMENIGFAHGYAGVVYSLTCILDFLKQGQLLQDVKNKIKCMVTKIERMTYPDGSLNESLNDSWCNGLVGIGYVLLKLNSLKNDLDLSRLDLKHIVSKIVYSDRNDDCICHGNFGKAGFLQNLLVNENRYMNEDTILKKREDLFKKQFYVIRGMDEEPEYGLMPGLSGVAYEYLRYADPRIPNVLLLD